MNVPPFESKDSAFEIEKPELSGNTLNNLMRPSAELEAEYRPKLWQCLAAAVRTTTDPSVRAQLETVVAIYDWTLFGKPGEPLPTGLVAAIDNNGEKSLTLDSHLPFWTGEPGFNMIDALGVLQACGYDEIWRPIVVNVEQHRSQLDALLRRQLHETPEYRAIAAFNVPAPIKMKEQPLSPFMKEVLFSEAEYDIRERFGLRTEEVIMPFTLAGRALSRRKHQIDEQTERQKANVSSSEGVRRAREFFLPYLKSASMQKYDREIMKVGFDPENMGAAAAFLKPLEGRPSSSNDIMIIDCFTELAATNFSLSIGQQYSDWNTQLGRAFAEKFISNLYDDRVESSLDEVIEVSYKEWLRKLQKSRFSTLAPPEEENFDPLWPGIVGPSSQSVSLEAIRERNEELYNEGFRISDEVGFNSAESIARKHSSIRGNILQQLRGVDIAKRIVQYQPMPPSFPVYAPKIA